MLVVVAEPGREAERPEQRLLLRIGGRRAAKVRFGPVAGCHEPRPEAEVAPLRIQQAHAVLQRRVVGDCNSHVEARKRRNRLPGATRCGRIFLRRLAGEAEREGRSALCDERLVVAAIRRLPIHAPHVLWDGTGPEGDQVDRQQGPDAERRRIGSKQADVAEGHRRLVELAAAERPENGDPG